MFAQINWRHRVVSPASNGSYRIKRRNGEPFFEPKSGSLTARTTFNTAADLAVGDRVISNRTYFVGNAPNQIPYTFAFWAIRVLDTSSGVFIRGGRPGNATDFSESDNDSAKNVILDATAYYLFDVKGGSG